MRSSGPRRRYPKILALSTETSGLSGRLSAEWIRRCARTSPTSAAKGGARGYCRTPLGSARAYFVAQVTRPLMGADRGAVLRDPTVDAPLTTPKGVITLCTPCAHLALSCDVISMKMGGQLFANRPFSQLLAADWSRTSTRLPSQGPEPCASANSATAAMYNAPS